MNTIQKISALEILDSRGNPTVSVTVVLSNGITATAGVPSGASTGIKEAVELRDKDPKRYGGKGVLQAVANVNRVIAPKLKGKSPHAQKELDDLMCKLDGTDTKAKLGANAILGASMAACRAAALDGGLPLYAHIRKLFGGKASAPYVLPAPMMNVLNGGAHATNNVDFQEFMLFPIGAATFAEALRYGAETFHTLKKLLQKRGLVTAVGDEGGFAPNLKTNTEAVEVILEAIGAAGYQAGKQVAIALDPAASEFYDEGAYVMKKSDGSRKTPAELVALWSDWVKRYPDRVAGRRHGRRGPCRLAGTDQGAREEGPTRRRRRVRHQSQDLQRKASGTGWPTAILIKLNQIGTVSETLETVAMAQKAGYGTVISHRSGETEDAFIADLAVGTGAGQIKTGSACRSERIAKYNRLLAIEQELGKKAQYGGPLFRKDR